MGATNAWKLYDVMYDSLAESSDKMPPKWTHREFLEELVNDLIWPERTQAHVQLLTEMDDASYESEVNSVKFLSAFGKLTCTDLEQYDFVSLSGQAAYLADMTPTSVTTKRLEKSYFIRRLDRLRHATIACVEGSYC